MDNYKQDEGNPSRNQRLQGWMLTLGMVLGGLIGLGIALAVGGTEALVNGLIFGGGFGMVFGLAFSYFYRRIEQE